MEIRVHFPYRWLITGIILCIFIAVIRGSKNPENLDQGGISQREYAVSTRAILGREEIRNAVLSRKEEIMKYEFSLLEEEVKKSPNQENTDALNNQRKALLQIIGERHATENLITRSLEELWESEGDSVGTAEPGDIVLDWPVAPTLGISAQFQDAAYLHRFGVPHHAIDIPAPQGTLVRAPAKGIVTDVSENGLGYSHITLQHDEGISTIYGHVSGVLVERGAVIERGEPLALSGGVPGTRGAGLLTTGPHLHFAVRQNGLLVDPLPFLRHEP